MINLEKLKELEKNASPGPWYGPTALYEEWGRIDVGVFISRKTRLFDDWEDLDNETQDFIAAARTAVPELIKAVEIMREALDRIEMDSGRNPPGLTALEALKQIDQILGDRTHNIGGNDE